MQREYESRYPVLLRDSISVEHLQALRRRIAADDVEVRSTDCARTLMFPSLSIKPADYVRAIQEVEMLKTKLMRKDNGVFWLNYDEPPVLGAKLMGAADECEETWTLQHELGYRLAANFMHICFCGKTKSDSD